MSNTTCDLKKIWEVEIDILEKLKSICKKYNLKYCAGSGTLLGAVRHNGFIPWDDDIDVSLLWSDYKIFTEVAQKECEYPYCFQSFHTNENAIPNCCRIRRSDTTGMTRWELENICDPDYDKGIFIDIFPLFYVPDSEEERAKQKKTVLDYWKIIRGHDALNFNKKTGKTTAYDEYIPAYKEYCEKIGVAEADIVKIKEAYIDACVWGDKRSSLVGSTANKCHVPTSLWPPEWFEDLIELPFENTTIACPRNYEKYLDIHFGLNWRTPIKGGAEHQFIALDTETPWREFDMTKLEYSD